MIAIDLSPLALDPRRGVSRALLHLLAGLEDAPHGGVSIEGFLPPVPTDRVGLGRGSLGLDAVHAVGGWPPRPHAWRRALAAALRERGARVLLSPWAAFPRTPVPVVAWIHEVPFARLGAVEGTLRTLRHRRALARAADRAAALVTPSDAVRADLERLHPEAARRVHVVPHGFDPEPWSPGPGAVPLRAPGGAGGPALELLNPARRAAGGDYAVAVGTGLGAAGAWKKGLDVVAEAFAGGSVAGLTAVVVGRLPRATPPLRALPDLEDGEVREVVRDARVVVVPSRSEGFGYPLLEGFAAGVPVVASAAGALPEVSGGAARLVPPGDVDALREAIERVATDEDLRARLVHAGRRRAREFPVEAMARGWLRVLTDVGGMPWRG